MFKWNWLQTSPSQHGFICPHVHTYFCFTCIISFRQFSQITGIQLESQQTFIKLVPILPCGPSVPVTCRNVSEFYKEWCSCKWRARSLVRKSAGLIWPLSVHINHPKVEAHQWSCVQIAPGPFVYLSFGDWAKRMSPASLVAFGKKAVVIAPGPFHSNQISTKILLLFA